MTYQELKDFITTKMRMSHVYQPVMLVEILKKGGYASTEQIAKSILNHDPTQVDYYKEVVKNMVGKVLTSNRGITSKTGDTYSLIDAENTKRNKTAFQIFFYSYLVQNGYQDPYDRIEPTIFNSKHLFDDKFDWRLTQKEKGESDIKVQSFGQYSDGFEEVLSELLTEIWNTETVFDQTRDFKKCEYCPYNGICKRV